MNDYSIALFLHIVGALGFSVALSLEWTGLRQIRSATAAEQVRAWMGILKNARRAGFASMLTTVVSGFYMMATVWGGAPRMTAIGKALATEKGMLSQNFHSLASHPLLWTSIQTRVAITLGIVFLKVVKPDWAGSLLTIGVAIVLGLVSTLPMPHRERAQERSAS
jgi:hypothetical protein